MRKLGYILSTVLYLVLTIGVSLNSHYCGGRLLDTYVYATPQCPFCDFNGMEMKSEEKHDCCEDETKFYAVDDSQQLIAQFSLGNRSDILLYEAGFMPHLLPGADEDNGEFFDHSSPPPDQDLTVLYSKYIYYG